MEFILIQKTIFYLMDLLKISLSLSQISPNLLTIFLSYSFMKTISCLPNHDSLARLEAWII